MSENLKGTDHLREVGEKQKILLTWISKQIVSEDVQRREIDSTVGGEFTCWLEDCQLVKKQLSVDSQPVNAGACGSLSTCRQIHIASYGVFIQQ